MCNCNRPICDNCNKQLPKPHKHAAVIKAWADGAIIEYRSSPDQPWKEIHNPGFMEYFEYRVKPEPHKWQKEMDAYAAGKIIQYRWRPFTPRWINCVRGEGGLPAWYTDEGVEYRIKPEQVAHRLAAGLMDGIPQVTRDRSRENLELTFEDGKLIKAEVLS